MLQYIAKRILLFIPALLVISFIAFIINTEAPGDPAARLVNASIGLTESYKMDRQKIIDQKRKELGLDLPVFYFNVGSLDQSGASLQSWKKYVPVIHFYGSENQYHKWISRIILRGDFGTSYVTQLPVANEILSHLPWTLLLTFLSTLLAFGISIPIGMYAAEKKGRFFDKFSSVGLFILFSLPNFFVASMLLVFFANPQFFGWFPESGVQDAVSFNDNWSLWIKMEHWAPYLVLPLITYTYSSFAFLSRQMRAGALEIFGQEYITTARAKGLPEGRVLWKHVFRNSLAPIITAFANAFPVAVTGSIIVETLFSIPGMGREIYQAVLNYDYPVVVAVFMIIGLLSLTGYLVSDVIYALTDPRVSFSKK